MAICRKKKVHGIQIPNEILEIKLYKYMKHDIIASLNLVMNPIHLHFSLIINTFYNLTRTKDTGSHIFAYLSAPVLM